MTQLPVLPILLPLLGGALSLFIEHRRVGTVVQRSVAWIFMLATVLASVLLVLRAHEGTVLVYLLGDWPARIGIALMVDRLSAMMVLSTSLLGAACLLHACSGWDRRAPHFHALFQLQLMGINGAFLTGDIFNLFVFFEVMLIASYGLLLSGGRGPRISAGLHYVAFNIAASTLFLIALGWCTASSARSHGRIAARTARCPPTACPWPRPPSACCWWCSAPRPRCCRSICGCRDLYPRAAACAASSHHDQVGLYAVLRISSLMLARCRRLAGYAGMDVARGGRRPGLATSGSWRPRACGCWWPTGAGLGDHDLIAFGLARRHHVRAVLHGAQHLRRRGAVPGRRPGAARPRRRRRCLRAFVPAPGVRVMAGAMFMVGAISVAGLPPLSGFIGKTLLLQAVPDIEVQWAWPAILGSSMLVVVGLTRAGTRIFWKPVPVREPVVGVDSPRRARGRLRLPETLATMLLLAYGIAMSVAPGAVTGYTRATAEQLLAPSTYVDQVRGAVPQRRLP